MKERLRNLRETLLTDLVERDEPVRLALLAALAGEHLLIVGPPGTAKSETARRLHLAFEGAEYFERLLTRFTVPEELFGPFSIKGLEEDRYERQTRRYLPTAAVAFLDEIFKANSAILNSLLTLLNERLFDNGNRREETPLVCVIGASNELPKGDELAALYDRFLLRYRVGPVSDEGFTRLLENPHLTRPVVSRDLKLTPEDLKRVREEARSVRLPDEVRSLLESLRKHLLEQKIEVSDRRWVKIVKLLQVSAFTDGRSEVSLWDCWLLQHCTWNLPEQRQAVFDWYQARVGTGEGNKLDSFGRFSKIQEGLLKREKEDQQQSRDEKGRLLYISESGEPVVGKQGPLHRKNREGELLYLRPSSYHDRTNNGNGVREEDLTNYTGPLQVKGYIRDKSNWLMVDGELPPCMEPKRYSEGHVQQRLKTIEGVSADVSSYLGGLDHEIASLTGVIDGHLWIKPGFAQPALTNLKEKREKAAVLLKQLDELREGFQGLARVVEEVADETRV